jgi:hypothetical protein
MSLVSPDEYYRSVTDIDLEALRSRGITALLLDIDNTILPRDTGVMPDELANWVRALADGGFRVCLVSNNWHDHVKKIADALGIEMIPKALKPMPHGFRKAIRLLGVDRRETAVIGDQIFTDILGANLAGMTSILVLPLCETDLAHTLVLRRVEHRIMAGRSPLP